jgi:hypothetical protein
MLDVTQQSRTPPLLPVAALPGEGHRLVPSPHVTQVPDSLAQDPGITRKTGADLGQETKQAISGLHNGGILHRRFPSQVAAEEAEGTDILVTPLVSPHLSIRKMLSMGGLESPLGATGLAVGFSGVR